MIPADLATRLRLVLPDVPAPPQPSIPSQQLADVLSELVPGQRIMAEIQLLLPNGTYRATIAQRDVTLALPFSAKPGDSLELEVVESGGRTALAVVANRQAAAPAEGAAESVPTSLSPTGRLISDLLGGIGEDGRRARPAPLNGNQPLVENFPDKPADLAPALREALAKSGMFYESHQARWVAGDLPKEALLQEPQGQAAPRPPAASPAMPQESQPAPVPLPAGKPAADMAPPAPGQPAPSIAPELAPLVQQQLDALSTQNFAWQGQVWPGQQMQWEIEADRPPRQEASEEEAAQWRTRLRLSLPRLGDIDAVLQLRPGGDVELALNPGSEASRDHLLAAGDRLSRQLADAGLRLTGFRVDHGPVQS